MSITFRSFYIRSIHYIPGQLIIYQVNSYQALGAAVEFKVNNIHITNFTTEL